MENGGTSELVGSRPARSCHNGGGSAGARIQGKKKTSNSHYNMLSNHHRHLKHKQMKDRSMYSTANHAAGPPPLDAAHHNHTGLNGEAGEGYYNDMGDASIYPEKHLLQALGSHGGALGHHDNNNSRHRKLVLHFDVRNTVLVADSVWSVNVEQALNCYLSGVTWGRETADGQWEWVSTEPSLKPPEPGLITYYKHVERQTKSTADDRAALRRLTGDFTQQEAGRRFQPHFRRLLELLQWQHREQDELLTMFGKDGRRYHYLIPAFLHLLKALTQRRRQFGIVVRTYGMDAPQVLRAVERTVRGHHPSFPEPIPLEVHTQPGRVVRGPGDAIKFERTSRAHPHATPRTEVVGSEGAIYRLLSASEGVTGYVDHFEYWSKHDFGHQAAKPFWIDLNDPTVQHIFFDDNIRAMDDDSIVDVRMFTDSTRSKARSLTMEEWIKYEESCLVQADLLNSIGNINYFVEKIEECERNYDQLLKKANATGNTT